MKISRRHFIGSSLLALPGARALAADGCWLSVCVPLVVEDPALNLHTDLILTSASFAGVEGYRDRAHATDYEITLYDPAGKPLPVAGGKDALRLSVSAMQTTLIRCAELTGGRDAFWGAARIRLRARGKRPTHAGDLFSAAFARWNYADSFDTLHAHPDPLQLQMADSFYSSMPFPSLEEHACALSVFNPYPTASAGRIILFSGDGRKQVERPYTLAPHATQVFHLNAEAGACDFRRISAPLAPAKREISKGGSVLIENDRATVKNFAYLMMKGRGNNAFAAEHTIHQGNYPVRPGASPFGPNQSFKARGWVYSPFVFNRKTIAGLDLSTRVYLSAGRPLEDELWLLAYATDAEGGLRWSTRADQELGRRLPPGFLSEGAIKLKPFQSCQLDFTELALPAGFAGGIGVATAPPTSHVLMKAEVRVHNWGTSAFTHFRPGLRSARALQGIAERGGLVSDYVVTGAHVRHAADGPRHDSLLGILNMEEDRAGDPTLEVFGKDGFITSRRLGRVLPSACRHLLLSELFPEWRGKEIGPVTLRLMDGKAAVILSALHIDYRRRDVALDHGSDRFSTFIDHGCQ